MAQKVRIRRDQDTGRWKVEPPAFGFGERQAHEFSTFAEALRWTDRHINRQAPAGVVQERATPGRGDVAAVSRARQSFWGWN